MDATLDPPENNAVGIVADTVLIPPWKYVVVVPAAGVVYTFAYTSQSPEVIDIDVIFLGTLAAIATPDTVLLKISPTLPAAALSFVVVPIIPDVELNVILGVVIPVVNVGASDSTAEPVPVEVITPVPPLLTGNGTGIPVVNPCAMISP